MYRTVFWTLWERERVEWFGRMALKHVYYHMWNRSPVQVRCMIQDARGWCTGIDDPDGWDGEGGGGSGWGGRWGFRMGNTCTPMADSCQCMAKPIQYCKVIRLQLKKFFNVCFLTIRKKKVVLGTAGGLPSFLRCSRLLRRRGRCQRAGVGLAVLRCRCSEHQFINEEIGAQSDWVTAHQWQTPT